MRRGEMDLYILYKEYIIQLSQLKENLKNSPFHRFCQLQEAYNICTLYVGYRNLS